MWNTPRPALGRSRNASPCSTALLDDAAQAVRDVVADVGRRPTQLTLEAANLSGSQQLFDTRGDGRLAGGRHGEHRRGLPGRASGENARGEAPAPSLRGKLLDTHPVGGVVQAGKEHRTRGRVG